MQDRMLKQYIPGWDGHENGPPILVHCSAGIGRAGCFVAIDICIQRLKDTRKVNVADVVTKLRAQRAHAIQTGEQVGTVAARISLLLLIPAS